MRRTNNQNTIAQAALDRWMKLNGVTKQTFGPSLGNGKSCGYEKYKDTGRLTVEELRLMNLTAQELIEIVGVRK